MSKTGIEYLDLGWNPIAMRCTPCSEGCQKCWHLRMAGRLAANPTIPVDVRDAYAGKVPPMLLQERLEEPLRRKKPARIGVEFMGDLFCETVPTEYIAAVLKVAAACKQHTFVILTKRAKRMAELCGFWWGWELKRGYLDNVWFGVTVENQKRADERIPLLLQIPAAVRWVSYEPALGPVDFTYITADAVGRDALRVDAPNCVTGSPEHHLDWVILGAETGPGARPMDPAWARDVRDQCQKAGVPFFYKRGSDGSRLLDGQKWEQWPKREVADD